jgi:hypothetical protein
MGEDEAKLLASLTIGSLGDALASDPAQYLEQRRMWLERLSSLRAADYRGIFELAAEAADDRERAVSFLKWAEAWYQDILTVQVMGKATRVRNADMAEQIRRRAALSDPDSTLSALAAIGRAAHEVQRNYNCRLVLENLLMRALGDLPRA